MFLALVILTKKKVIYADFYAKHIAQSRGWCGVGEDPPLSGNVCKI